MDQVVQAFEQKIITMPLFVIRIMLIICMVTILIASLILNYHWKTYGMQNPIIEKSRTIYFVGITIIMVVIVITAVLFDINRI